jgi:hypothetical protein
VKQERTDRLVRVRVRVTLPLAVYRQSVRLGAEPLDTHGHIFFSQMNTCSHSPYITSSLTKGWIYHLQLLLALASAFILGSESRGTRDHILLSQIRDFPLCHLLRLAGHGPHRKQGLYCLGNLFTARYLAIDVLYCCNAPGCSLVTGPLPGKGKPFAYFWPRIFLRENMFILLFPSNGCTCHNTFRAYVEGKSRSA